MAEWSEWFQDVGKSVINAATDARFVQPYEIDKLRLQALGELGYYNEGQAGSTRRTQSQGVEISPTLLLLGFGVLAVMMLKD